MDQSVSSELGDFLRSRRDRLSPEAVGLPGGRRRRTPGLRREEVAQSPASASTGTSASSRAAASVLR